MSIIKAINSGIRRTGKPLKKEILGVPVTFQPTSGGKGWSEWESILNRCLRVYDEVGWLEDFNGIFIGDNIIRGNAAAKYYDRRGTMDIENDCSIEPRGTVLSDQPKGVLTHEFVHHAHMRLGGFENGNQPPKHQFYMMENVSYYARHSVFEAIAEIGTGIVLGHDFSNRVHSFYEAHNGPEGVYDIAASL